MNLVSGVGLKGAHYTLVIKRVRTLSVYPYP